jgi:osmoprotectant transport system permease protein
VQLTLVSVALALAAAVPLAVLATRWERAAAPMLWLANAGQTMPSLAVLALMLPVLGIGFRPSVAALAIRAFLPIFLNTYVGVRSADAAAVDAARGMGATGLQRLAFVELPLAAPIIYAGIQTATVQNVGIATIAAFIGGGGLGELILQGLQMLDPPVLLAGAIPVAAFAVTAEMVLRGLGRVVVPAGVRAGGR